MNTLIIAEAGVNHNGSMELAKKLIDAAVEAKARTRTLMTVLYTRGIFGQSLRGWRLWHRTHGQGELGICRAPHIKQTLGQ